MKDSLIILVQRLLKRNKISFDKEEVSFQIQSHPSYPSIHAITGVLAHFNIENVAAEVLVDLNTLNQLPDCFIAQVKDNEKTSLVVVERKTSNYLMFTTGHKIEETTEQDFLNKFTGIIVAVEKPEQNQSKNNANIISHYFGFGLIGIFTAIILYPTNFSMYTLVHLILSGIGIVVSVAIIKQELGLQTVIGNAFCSGLDDKKDCDAVLTSKGAEVINGLKLSDFSVLYFSTLTVVTLLQITNPLLPFWVSLLAIPITLYSIYYQSVVIKKWCFLCLSIVAILWLQASISLLSYNFANEFVIKDFAVLGIVFIGKGLLLRFIQLLIIEVYDLRKEKIASVKFKRNFELFSGLLQKSSQINTDIENSQGIILGNSNSNIELTIITNPFCGHCKPVHQHIHEILHRYKNKVKIKICFNVNTQNSESKSVKVTSRLLEIYHDKGEQAYLQAMNDIYGGEKPLGWFDKWGTCHEKENYILELDKQSAWCTKNNINFTPEILINGKSYPKEYDRSDLIFFIEELEENSNQSILPQKEMQSA